MARTVRPPATDVRDVIPSGGTRYFEYHCDEGEDSPDRWLCERSHQRVRAICANDLSDPAYERPDPPRPRRIARTRK